MPDQVAISTVEPREKLRNLEQYMPKQQDLIYRFGAFLADRMDGSESLLPIGFIMLCELALYDLHKGVSGFTGETLPAGLTGYPPIIYNLLGMSFPLIAKAVFPSDFADEVEKILNAIKEEMRAKSDK